MSLDRPPSPQVAGGWSSPGLTAPYEDVNPRSANGPTWASAKASSARVNGVPSYQSRNSGFFGRHMRRISASLPMFMHGGEEDRVQLKEKPLPSRLGPGLSNAWNSATNRIPKRWSAPVRKRRNIFTVLLVLFSLLLWFQRDLTYTYRRTSWLGGGSKFVIILAANEEGGVMYWKGAKEWAIERDSMKNKKEYAQRWGYDLEVVDMSTKKKYAHEWRESWEKADFIRNAMKKYPEAEWFWWLDLNTVIMEPSYSLQWLLFNDLKGKTYRDINVYNPLGIRHPPNGTSGNPNAPKYANYLDDISMSVDGDGKPESINLLISQDCGGFNLGSFFIRRGAWTDRLLDIWWDPVFYEQRHMEWEHKEQDALEYLYTNQPWVRPHVAFVPQRTINAFPDGACGQDRGLPNGGCREPWDRGYGIRETECGVQGVHYQMEDRDFFINMAGCEWGRDCWSEMYNYRQMSRMLNRSRGEKFRDYLSETWHAWTHPTGKPPPPPPEHGPPAQPMGNQARERPPLEQPKDENKDAGAQQVEPAKDNASPQQGQKQQ